MLNFTKEVYSDLFVFLNNPEEKPAVVQPKSEKAKKLFALLILDLPIMGLLVGILSVLEKAGLFDLESNKMTMLFLSFPTWLFILLLVILVPFFEELIFRLYLRYKYNYLLRFLVFLTSIAGTKNHRKVKILVKRFWIKRYKHIFYFSAIVFGLVHLTNYNTTLLMVLFSPIVVAPQIVAGLFCGYLRVRHGLLTGFLMHAMHNAIFLCIPLLFISGSMDNIKVETKAYSMEMGKSNSVPNTSFFRYFNDSVIFNHVSIKTILAEVLNKDEMLIKSNNESFMNIFIDLKFKRKHLEETAAGKDIDYQFLRKSILDELSKTCGFKIKSELITQEVWELSIVDSTLLAKCVTDSIKSNRIDGLAGEVSSTNTSMWHLSKALSRACNKRIVNKTGTKRKYALKLQTNNFEALQKQLTTEYGLSLTKAEQETEYINIEF
jgi:membrane protease YdiL (CAAX protease family)